MSQPEINEDWGEATPLNECEGPLVISEEDRETILTELAALNPIEYDQQREARAKDLGCRAATLDAAIYVTRAPVRRYAGRKLKPNRIARVLSDSGIR